MTVISRFYLLTVFTALMTCMLFTKPVYATEIILFPPQKLHMIEQGIVSEILKADLIRLNTGSLYVLDNIRVPSLYNDQALAWLKTHLLNQSIKLYVTSSDLDAAARDRMGNIFAHAVLDTNTAARWVQGDMVADGIAWADSSAANRTSLTELLAIEEDARSKLHGFWSNPGMRVRKADSIGGDRNQFMIITGTPVETANKKNVYFANFGTDWKTDFTISLTKENSRNFPSGFNIESLKDKPLRIRGWVFEKNGPMIELTHPEQFEFLPQPPVTKTVKTESPAP